MNPPPLIQEAVSALCARFASGGYGLTPVIDLGALVANADGTVDEKELEMLRYLFDALLGAHLGKDALAHLVRSSIQVILEAGLEPRARFLAEILVGRGAMSSGLTWHYCRPPVVDLDFEMDCRGIALERVVV